jgi:L-threonylcarbamoyladenylate synthase
VVAADAAASWRQQIEQGVAVLKKGGLVAFPTDTVYGLGARYDDEQAVARIYRLKKRPLDMPLPLLLADTDQIDKVAVNVPPIAWLLAGRFLPGALTLVLPKAAAVPDVVTGGGDTVAVRVPDHPVPLGLIRGVGEPIIGTSANLNGQPSAVSADEVRTQLGDGVDYIIDGGRCPGGRESTVVDVTGQVPKVIREGAVSWQDIMQACRMLW